MSVRVVPVPCLRDNVAYVVVEGDVAAVVDPGEAAPVLAAVASLGVRLVAVWCTHHHADHVGGVGELLAALGPIEVVASAHDVMLGRAPHATRALREGDPVGVGRVTLTAWEVPGHTLGALAFVGEGVAFTGDTLFGAGCGRVFEGTMPMMARSLARCAGLPTDTRLAWGHTYTAANVRWVRALGERFGVTLPEAAREAATPDTLGTVAEELATNVFLRACAAGRVPNPRGPLGEVLVALAREDAEARALATDAQGAYDAAAHAFALLRRAKDRG